MIGQALLESGALTPAQLEIALAQQRASGALLGRILLDHRFVTEDALARALARESGLPFTTAERVQPERGVAAGALPMVPVATDRAAIARLVARLLDDAIGRGASDLLVEPEDRIVRTRCRIDGVLVPGEAMPKDTHAAVVDHVRALGGLDGSPHGPSREGRVAYLRDGRRLDLQVAICPTTFGEQVRIRILERERLVRGIGELGFARRSVTALHDLLGRGRGVVLVTGPRGSGTTTTLYSMLGHLGISTRNVLTVESPVEYQLPLLRQVEVRPAAGLTVAEAVRTALRQDPDVLMIGEVGDSATARLALEASSAGVLVLGAMRTREACAAVPRLLDMGLEPYLLASEIAGVVAQRLLRVTCEACRTPQAYSPATLARVGLGPDPGLVFFRGQGCEACGGTGYRSRTGVSELLVVDAAIHGLIRDGADVGRLRHAAVSAGMKTLLDGALTKAIFGQTTLEEVIRVARDQP